MDVENLTPGTPTWEHEIKKSCSRGNRQHRASLLGIGQFGICAARNQFRGAASQLIFPVLIEGDDPMSTPLRLANHQRVDLCTKFEASLDKLAAAIKDYISIKQEFAAQDNIPIKEMVSPGPPIDLKKVGVPLLVAVRSFCCWREVHRGQKPR